MASLSSVNINVSKIPKEKLYEGKTGKFLQLTFVQNNDVDNYGNNVSVYVSQSKEEREEKKPKVYLGNGKVVWGDGKNVEPAPKDQPKDQPKDVGLPF
tara:strand:+ start:1444 stop:1737 length:294 start_codon:yes stop_codon:yes gene_type:complete